MPDTEVHSIVRNMQRNMQRAQASQTSRQYSAPQSGFFHLLKLPWWAWLIVAAHLLYRITKVIEWLCAWELSSNCQITCELSSLADLQLI